MTGWMNDTVRHTFCPVEICESTPPYGTVAKGAFAVMPRYRSIPVSLAIIFSLVGCAGVSYAPGEAPPVACRGANAEWRLARRDDVHSNRWQVAGEYTWSAWVAGQQLDTRSYGTVTSRLRNEGRTLWLKLESPTDKTFTSSALFRRVRDCVYMHDSRLLVVYARHAVRDDVLWQQKGDPF